MSAPFLRTSSGLSNQARFFGVDLVVYFEGGERQYTIAELEENSASSEDLDTRFWQTVFKTFRPRLRAHFKSIGSKQSVLPVCQLILAGTITNVVAALDRDWDQAKRKKLSHPNIVYTRGYSWENDVFTKSNLFELSKRLALSNTKFPIIKAKIDDCFGQFERAFGKLVLWEYALARAGAPPCNRRAINDAIQIRTPRTPKISRPKIAKLLWSNRESNRRVRLNPRVKGVSVSKDLCGHAVERFSLSLMQHICATDLNTKVPNEVCTRLLIEFFERSLKKAGPVQKHYRSAIRSIKT